MTFPIRSADGDFRMFLTLASPVRDKAGTIVRWFGTNTDIDAQRKAETGLRQAEKLAVVGGWRPPSRTRSIIRWKR